MSPRWLLTCACLLTGGGLLLAAAVLFGRLAEVFENAMHQ